MVDVSSIVSIIKDVVKTVSPPDKAAVPTPPANPKNADSYVGPATRPVIVANVPSLAPKTESTPVTYGQQYQIQTVNADGTVGLRTIPLSELQKNDITFDPRTSELTPILKRTEASLLQGLHLPNAAVQEALVAGLKADFKATIKSQESLPLEINLLQTPDLNASMQYNYYQPNESNIQSQENPTTDPFLASGATERNVPMFVRLTWDPVDTVSECLDFDRKTPEEEAIVQQFLKPVRGVANGTNVDQNKMTALLRQTNVLSRDGLTLELVDTHDLPTAFAHISNGQIYKHSALAVLNTQATDLNKVDFNDILVDEL